MTTRMNMTKLGFHFQQNQEDKYINITSTKNNKIIGEGYTSPYGGPHAEVNAINSVIDKSLLKAATLYVTLEPCQMCAGASYWTQIGKIVYGASEPKRGFTSLNTQLHPKTQVIKGILENECSQLLKRFFIEKRNLNQNFPKIE